MSKINKVDKDFKLINPENYILEIEDKVKAYLRSSINLPYYKKQERSVEPDSNDPSKISQWRIEEITKCHKGSGDVCGKMYFFFNYVFMKNIKGGLIRPEFRACDAEWFKLIEECQNGEDGWGVVCVKRRRVGASWKEAADVVHDMLFKKHFQVGMNSKSDRDSEHLFSKVLFIFDRLPSWMRVKLGRKNGMHLEYYKYNYYDSDGNRASIEEVKKLGAANFHKKKEGQDSSIIVVPPTDSAYEGMMLNKWVCDEAGKIDNLPQIWSFTEDCLMQETSRAGVPILFGTSGDISTNGGGLMHMWEKAEFYKLRKFFFAGWMGLVCDENGNDHKEEAIRWVLYERAKREKISMKEYNDFIQRYPLTPDEAFSQSGGGLGNIVNINAQRYNLRNNPPIESLGSFKYGDSGSVDFKVSKFGNVKIYEQPKEGCVYIAGCDPADHDDAGEQASDLSVHIMKLPSGVEPAKIVMEYCCRPNRLAEYYEQAAMSLQYYNGAKVLIENNRFRIIDYFKENDYGGLLARSPNPVANVFKKRINTIGVRMTEPFKIYMEGIISDYTDDYCEYIPSIDLLQEMVDYGHRNTDRVISFGLCLAYLKEIQKNKVNKKDLKNDITKPRIFYKIKNGRMVRAESKI